MKRTTARRSTIALVAGFALLAAGCAQDATSPDARTAAPPANPAPALSPNCMLSAIGATVCATQAANLDAWQLVSVGGDHTCALKTSGAAFCWGSNRYGQLGVATTSAMCGSAGASYPCSLAAQPVQPGVRFASISAGARHTCAITAGGEPVCWGSDDNGQVGAAAIGRSPGMKAPGGLGFIQISAGYSHTCAVRIDGAVFCWGANAHGELGDGSAADVSAPVRAALPSVAASVSAGQARTCARTTANVVYCWGAVWTNRENGWEMTRTQPVPELVPSAPALGTLSVGSFTTCGADASGSAYCWEANPRGEMGTGTQAGSLTPVRVAAAVGLSHVSSGMVQSCGVAPSGAGFCWGDDTFGELGVSPESLPERCDRQGLACSTLPIAVSGSLRFTHISTGFGSHTCGVTLSGDVACWGLGNSGQRGDGAASYVSWMPALVIEGR